MTETTFLTTTWTPLLAAVFFPDREVRALQLMLPDRTGRFWWQPGYPG